MMESRISDKAIGIIKNLSLFFGFVNLFAFIFANYSSSTSFKFFFLIGFVLNFFVYMMFRNSNYSKSIKMYATKYTFIFSVVLVIMLTSYTFLIHPFAPIVIIIFYIWLRTRK